MTKQGGWLGLACAVLWTTQAVAAESGAPSATGERSVAGLRVETTGETTKGKRYPDPVLRVVSPSDKSLDIGLLAVGALIGAFRLPGDKEDYKGTKIESLAHPAATSQFLTELGGRVSAWQAKTGQAAQAKNAMYVRPDTFSLVYTEFDAEPTHYTLSLSTTVSRYPDSTGFFIFSPPPAVVCQDKFTEARPLPEWAAEDYQAVKALALKHVENCLDTVAENLAPLFGE